MGEVVVTVNGQRFQLACRDGEEQQIGALASYVDEKVSGLVNAVGNLGDTRLLLMASLIIADELMEARHTASMAGAAGDLGERLETAASQIEDIAAGLESA